MAQLTCSVTADGLEIPVYRTKVLIAGSGAASLSCALHLSRMGEEDVLVVTDNLNGGTSRNTGSDKQTYYKLSDSTLEPDSAYDMAEALAGCGCVNGDIALVEAVCSSRAFYNLVNIGVPFPHNRYGGYTGYKTDHDPASRGTSTGPFTSKLMVECLLDEVNRYGTEIWNSHDVVRILSLDGEQHTADRSGAKIAGVLVMDKHQLNNGSFGLKIILTDNLVLGLGGPAGLYESSVYPKIHTGGIGLALEIGAEAANLTESQFGIASIKHRWNLSGSYQQVIPAYYSTDEDGSNRNDFLLPYFSSYEAYTKAVFLKGYQWPFDSSKAIGGSSIIDLLIYIERMNGRRVFMDFRENPAGKASWGDFNRNCVSKTALEYLDNSAAWAKTPIRRLGKLNPDSIELYRMFGINLETEALEIDVCAQHNNGGLAGDIWWESTNISRLFPIGEINGSHGISRPGGSALNSGQVGALRAAQRIVSYSSETREMGPSPSERTEVLSAFLPQIESIVAFIRTCTGGSDEAGREDDLSPEDFRQEYRRRMSIYGGMVRDPQSMSETLASAASQMERASHQRCSEVECLPQVLKNRHMVITHFCYLAAMADYLENGGGSRGSCIVLDSEGSEIHGLLGERWKLRPENIEKRNLIQIIRLKSEGGKASTIVSEYRRARPIPMETYWFEKVWSDFKSNSHIKEKK
ncbi:MAG: FAD-binding protein [Spirochaetales bacterium]|nr:FAD-binding protein [Spirochaetales bacterium]